jgi:addiction module RelE/StbE family toxin
MAKIRWTTQAADDLESIVNFISLDSQHYARLTATDIIEAVERLTVFPKSGRIVPETNVPKIREILFGNYRIIYRLRKDVIEVITVYHSSRLLDPRTLKKC